MGRSRPAASAAADRRWRAALAPRGDVRFTRGDVPFYARPFVVLRGVPALRDQGLHPGIDAARGPEDTVLYLQVGSACQ
jgi:hypothetical protein